MAKVKRNRKPKKERTNYRYTPEFMQELGEKLNLWIADDKQIWLGDFAAQNRMGSQRISELASTFPEFADILEVAKQIQVNRLFRLGLSKKFNAAMPIFALKNVAGWREVQELQHTGGVKILRDNIKSKLAEKNAAV